MTVLTQAPQPGEAIMSEGNFHISRETVVVALSQTIVANSLLAALAIVAGVDVTQSYSGTGNGVLTPASPPVNSLVKDGVYRLICTTAAANAGTFQVEDPNGRVIGEATVGVLFNKEIKFTIADGATDFVVGDTFNFIVAANADDFQYVAYNPSATDGSQIPSAYSPYPVVTDGVNTKKASALVRHCELNINLIQWPAGITLAQKQDAIQALGTKSVILR
jgi:hypothetical protein